MAKMTIDEVLDNKYITDSSLAQQLVAGTLSLDDQIIKDHVHQVGAYIAIYESGDERLLNNQIKYNATRKLTILDGVDYTEHTFDDGVGLVTFNNDLTELESDWFSHTFDNYAGNITSLTLPNSVSEIGMGALTGANTAYYEGTQKECARIVKDVVYGTGVTEYHCSDGIVDSAYISNRINPLLLAKSTWFKDLIGENLQDFLSIVSSVKIDEHPEITAREYITMLVNGTEDNPGLSTYGFHVATKEIKGVTIPFAVRGEFGHFIGITKATNYAQVDSEHVELVATDESLDPDYMYVLFDDTSVMVDVTIVDKEGSTETITLNTIETYAEQGYSGHYSQNTYNSSVGETSSQFLVDGRYPVADDTIYSYCDDTAEPEGPEVIEEPTE